jgi:hypothetical protein
VSVVWGDDVNVTWDNASDDVKRKFALDRLFWFFRMVDSGGPDGSELDAEVEHDARVAAEWYGPILRAQAEAAGIFGLDDL